MKSFASMCLGNAVCRLSHADQICHEADVGEALASELSEAPVAIPANEATAIIAAQSESLIEHLAPNNGLSESADQICQEADVGKPLAYELSEAPVAIPADEATAIIAAQSWWCANCSRGLWSPASSLSWSWSLSLSLSLSLQIRFGIRLGISRICFLLFSP